MAGQKFELGELVVRFAGNYRGLDAATRGSERRLGDFDSRTQKIAANVKRATLIMGAAFVGFGATVAATVKKINDEMDKITKQAQAAGVTVEQMSALGYAAQQSNVSVEELSRAFRNLARNMQGADRAPTDFSRALDALNITWRTAEGQFRSGVDIVNEVADQFTGLEDSANKTALAMKILGEEMGPRLIPLLNQGSSGIRRLTDEARSMGLVFDDAAGQAAESLNNAIHRLTGSVKGFATQITIELAPELTRLVNLITEQITATDAASGEWKAIGDIMKVVTVLGYGLARAFLTLTSALFSVGEAAKLAFQGKFTEASQVLEDFLMETGRANLKFLEFAYNVGAGVESMLPPLFRLGEAIRGISPKKGDAPGLEDETAALEQRANAIAFRTKELTNLLSDPTVLAQDKFEALQKAVEDNIISLYDYEQAVKQVNQSITQSYLSMAGDAVGALEQMFEGNKTVAIASAIVNTLEGVTKALAAYPPPFSYAMAALQAAAGFAQVQKIKSTTPGSSGGASTSGLSGGSSASAAGGQAQGAGGNTNTLRVVGIGPNDLFKGEMVRDLSNMILDYQREGGKVILGGLT